MASSYADLLPEAWQPILGPTIDSQPDAETFLGGSRADGILPVRELTFRAIVPHKAEDWNCVVFGQSPYPRIESATGIAMFDGKYKDWNGTLSPTLRNIIKNAAKWSDPKAVTKATKVGDLRNFLNREDVCTPEEWFEYTLVSRCLWLNTALTTGGGMTNSKHEKFWRPIVEKIVEGILEAKHESGSESGCVFVLWGGPAQKLRKMVEKKNAPFKVPIRFVECCNPAAQGDIFCNSDAFGDINNSLEALGMDPINWLPKTGWKSSANADSGAKKKRKKGAAAEDDGPMTKQSKQHSEEEVARISNFLTETVDLHKVLVERIKGVAAENALLVTNVLEGLELRPILSLKESLRETAVDKSLIDTALNFAKENPSPDLSLDCVAALHLYTMASPFYRELNKQLRTAKKTAIKPYLLFLRLFTHALSELNLVNGDVARSLWRGVDVDLGKDYKTGSTITWWGVSSCTTTEGVARGFMKGSGTLFEIKASRGVDVKPFSAFTHEDEVLLAPGTQLRITSSKKQGKMHVIKLVTLS